MSSLASVSSSSFTGLSAPGGEIGQIIASPWFPESARAMIARSPGRGSNSTAAEASASCHISG